MADVWKLNPLLNFKFLVSATTGEIIDGVQVAEYNGLIFTMKPKGDGTGFYCSVRGSLHKYFNEGKHNADGFNFRDVQTVVTDLRLRFGINPKTAVLQNLEFGLNINTPDTVKKALKGLISYNGRKFQTIKDKRKYLGESITYQQYSIKIYDKGKEYGIAPDIMRLEYSVYKMEYLKKYDIKTLHDLTEIHKIKPLGDLLTGFWDNVIYYDCEGLKYRDLSDFQQKKVLYYANPNTWEKFNRTQRMRAKNHFNDLMKKNNTSTVHKYLKNKTAKIWGLLSAKKCIRFNHEKPIIDSGKNVYDLTVKINGKNVYKSTPETPQTENTKNTPKTRVKNAGIFSTSTEQKEKYKTCVCCGSDISHKKANARYCSKKCNNKINGMKRNRKQKKQRQTENLGIEKVLKLIAGGVGVWLCIQTDTESVKLSPCEIQTDNKSISDITAVRVVPKDKRCSEIYLTAGRGRKLIRKINRMNRNPRK